MASPAPSLLNSTHISRHGLAHAGHVRQAACVSFRFRSCAPSHRSVAARVTGTGTLGSGGGDGLDYSATTPHMQTYIVEGKPIVVPLGKVQQLPPAAQGAIVASIFAALAAGTYLAVTTVGPALAAAAPAFYSFLLMIRVPFYTALFVLAGVGHFTSHALFASIYPKPGQWGFWCLPGSASFHVNWTGVAEVAGGLGLGLGACGFAALQPMLPPLQLQQAAALGLFLLTVVVSPANILMYTHNAPGPAKGALPWQAHVVRLLLQIVTLATFWDLSGGCLGLFGR